MEERHTPPLNARFKRFRGVALLTRFGKTLAEA